MSSGQRKEPGAIENHRPSVSLALFSSSLSDYLLCFTIYSSAQVSGRAARPSKDVMAARQSCSLLLEKRTELLWLRCIRKIWPNWNLYLCWCWLVFFWLFDVWFTIFFASQSKQSSLNALARYQYILWAHYQRNSLLKKMFFPLVMSNRSLYTRKPQLDFELLQIYKKKTVCTSGAW
jgi:hypothetical protein